MIGTSYLSQSPTGNLQNQVALTLDTKQLIAACNGIPDFRIRTSESEGFAQVYFQARISREFLGVPGSFLWRHYRRPDDTIDYLAALHDHIQALEPYQHISEQFSYYCQFEQDLTITELINRGIFDYPSTISGFFSFSDQVNPHVTLGQHEKISTELVKCGLSTVNDHIVEALLNLARTQPTFAARFSEIERDTITPYRLRSVEQFIKIFPSPPSNKEIKLITAVTSNDSDYVDRKIDQRVGYLDGYLFRLATYAESDMMMKQLFAHLRSEYFDCTENTETLIDQIATALVEARRNANWAAFEFLLDQLIEIVDLWPDISDQQIDLEIFSGISDRESYLFADHYRRLIASPAMIDQFWTAIVAPRSRIVNLTTMSCLTAWVRMLASSITIEQALALLNFDIYDEDDGPALDLSNEGHYVYGLEILDALIFTWPLNKTVQFLAQAFSKRFLFNQYLVYIRERVAGKTMVTFQYTHVDYYSSIYYELGVITAGRSSVRLLNPLIKSGLIRQSMITNVEQRHINYYTNEPSRSQQFVGDDEINYRKVRVLVSR